MLAINFHYVGMPEFPFSGVHGISNAQFKKFIVWVKENKHVIDPKDLNSSKPCKLEGSADQILLTFDDGLNVILKMFFLFWQRQECQRYFFPCAGMLENSSALSTHKAHFLRAQIPPEEFCSRIRDFL